MQHLAALVQLQTLSTNWMILKKETAVVMLQFHVSSRLIFSHFKRCVVFLLEVSLH